MARRPPGWLRGNGTYGDWAGETNQTYTVQAADFGLYGVEIAVAWSDEKAE